MQSDAVQASLVERFPEVSFLSIETSADGEIHAYSRVQMALSEARAKAAAEFTLALDQARHSLEEIREFVAAHAELRHPLFPIPRHTGVVSTAANFLLHTDHLKSARLTNSAGLHSQRGSRPQQAAMRHTHSTQEIES